MLEEGQKLGCWFRQAASRACSLEEQEELEREARLQVRASPWSVLGGLELFLVTDTRSKG